MLSLIQQDILTELVNVYICQAANLLSEMVNQKIELTIPQVQLITVSELDFSEHPYLSVSPSGHVISSSMSFGHEFQGKAFLVFPPEQAKLLVTACTGEILPLENEKTFRLLDTDLDILREIGNLIINAVIGEFGNLLDIKVDYSLPDIELISFSETDQQILLQNDIYILVLHTSFTLSETRITGAILIALSLSSVSLLMEKINELSEDLNG